MRIKGWIIWILVAAACCLWVGAGAEALSFAQYIQLHQGLKPANDGFAVWSGGDLSVQEGQTHSWQADVQGGLYAVAVTYTAAADRSTPIEARLLVDGQVPYTQAEGLFFRRLWQREAQTDLFEANGNQRRPVLVPAPVRQRVILKDPTGYTQGPLLLALPQGSHTIALQIQREAMTLHAVELIPAPQVPAYAKPTLPSGQAAVRIQGEDIAYCNDPALGPQSDRASVLTEPNRGARVSFNMIGGEPWREPGSALTWEVDVPETGAYALRIRARQNYAHAFYAMRQLRIDGEVPFDRVQAIPFLYDGGWQIITLGGETPLLVELTQGHHTLTLEAALGHQAAPLQRAQQVLDALNDLYTRILVITGAEPDPLRDYALERRLPDMLSLMAQMATELEAVIAELSAESASHGQDMVAPERLMRQLQLFVALPHEIPERYASFKNNLASLSEWLLIATERPLEIDYIELCPVDAPLPQAEAGFWRNTAYQAELFLDSFVSDYNLYGTGSDSGRSITVWVGDNRDVAQALNDLIRRDFTPKTGISVNLQLVQSDYVTPAIAVGDGPDILVGGKMSNVVDYASRHALLDLKTFPDYQQIAQRFLPEASVPFAFEGGVYALPESMSFAMMFYRKDILGQLNVQPPDNWDEMVALIPVLSRSYMTFLIDGRLGLEDFGSLTALSMFLLQRGGAAYAPDGTASALDSEVAVEAFKHYTRFYTNYGLPFDFNRMARFRSGEAPIMLTDYGTYNYLLVAAPELAGQWGMLPMPGTLGPDGRLNRASRMVVNGDMILRGCQDPDAAWAFLKWLTEANTQISYSQRLESLVGTSARHQTANLEALTQLGWARDDLRSLQSQWQHAKALPEVPGGYYTTWHIENAFRAVVLRGEDPRESLLDYVRIINEEITAKRQELGLSTGEEGDAP